MHNRGSSVTSTYQETSSSSIGGPSCAAPSIGRIRITQTSEQRSESIPDSQAWNQASSHSAIGSRVKDSSYYDRRYSISTSGGYSSSGQINGDVSKSYRHLTPLSDLSNQHHRRYSVTTDRVHSNNNVQLDGFDNLDFEAEEYLAKEIRPYKSSVRKIAKQTRNHFVSSSGSANSSGGADLSAPYVSPYRRIHSPVQRVTSPSAEFVGEGCVSPHVLIRRRAPGLRAGSMPRIETLETLRESHDSLRRKGHGRSMSVTRGVGSRRAAADLVDAEFGGQPMDLGHEDDSYELRRQLRVARNRSRASSASRLDPTERAGSVPAGDVRVIYPPRYPISSIITGSPVYNNSSAEIHIVQSMGRGGGRSPLKRRAASVSRVSYTGGVPRVIESPLPGVSHHRASSTTARSSGSYTTGPGSTTHYTTVRGSVPEYSASSSASFLRMSSESGTRLRDPTLYGARPGQDDEDLTRYVLEPGEKFLPTDVSVSMLPSGEKAVTYTKFSQTGTGDQRQANVEIERIIQKTKKLQDSLNTLEDFVRRNRSLFPEDIIIYQKIIFYLLGTDELRAHGYPPDAEVYGVKIREKLVAPYGTDVASILKRHYKRYTEVDVIYEEREAIRRRLREAELETKEEAEEERRRKRRIRVDTEIIEEEEEWLRRRREAARKRQHQDELYIDEEELHRRPRPSPRRRGFEDGAEPPQFTASPKSRTVGGGDTVKFSCAVLGYPEPTIQWFHNNRPLFNSSRHTIDDRYIGSSSICIRNANKEDAGSYTARAANMHGEVSASATLYIEEDEMTRRKEALRRPWFIHEVHNTTTQVGQMIVLEAQATGKPLPTFRWQRNNIDIVDDVDHVRVVSDGAGGTKLIIRDVRTSDAGLYVCIAENSAGRTACSATLRVGESFDLTEYYTLPKFGDLPDLPPPHDFHPTPTSNIPRSRLPQLPFELDEIIMKNWQNPAGFYLDFDGEEPAEGRRPRFVRVPSTHITVQEGDPLTLRCTVDGQPKPLVKWYKGVRELTYTGRHRVLAEGNDSHMMQIRMTMLTDPGEYTIVALNTCGMVKYTVFVNVVPRSPDEIEETRKRPELALQEYDLIKKTAQGKMAPVFIRKLPREKELIVGGTLKIECHVEEAKMREYLVGYDIVVKDAGKGQTTRSGFDSTSHPTVNGEYKPSSSGAQPPATNLSSGAAPNLDPSPGMTTTLATNLPQSSSSITPDVQSSTVDQQVVEVTPNIKEQVQNSSNEINSAAAEEVLPQCTNVAIESPVQPVPEHTMEVQEVPESTIEVKSVPQVQEIPVGAMEIDATGAKKSKAKKSKKSGKAESLESQPTSSEAMNSEMLEDLEAVLSSTKASGAESVPTLPQGDLAVTDAGTKSVEPMEVTTSLAGKERVEEVSFASSGEEEEIELQGAGSTSAATETSASSATEHKDLEQDSAKPSEVVGEPARLLTMLESSLAPMGSSASFTCSVAGHPPLNVQWLREGRLIEESDNVRIANTLNTDGTGSCRLEVSKIGATDEGSYTVRVSNAFGECSCTASLSIIGTVIPQISVTFDDIEQDDEDELSELSEEND